MCTQHMPPFHAPVAIKVSCFTALLKGFSLLCETGLQNIKLLRKLIPWIHTPGFI